MDCLEEDERSMRYARSLARLLQQETVSSDDDPRVEVFRGFLALLREMFPHIFAACVVEDFDGSLLMRWPGRDAQASPVLFMNHMDVVGAEGTWGAHGAFSGDIAEGRVWGRGALDTKGGLWAMLTAADELAPAGFAPACDVYFESSRSEEVVLSGADAITQELVRRGVRFRFSMDEGGYLLHEPLGGADADFAMIGVGNKQLAITFGNGSVSLLPAVLMILMASSIRYTLECACVLDTILYGIVGLAGGLPSWSIILLMYAVALIIELFVPSGTAKAFMLMPLFVPMAQLFGIPVQLTVVAYAFGDGFCNVFYPTNPALLISLGLAGLSYVDWLKWSLKFQLANLALTSGLLLFGLAIGYC